MENYKKGKNVEEELTQDRIPIDVLPEKFLWMHVKGGTKVSNVVEYAEKAFASGDYRSVVWSGSGGGVPKTISCAEIMKRNLDVHQVTQLAYQKIEEYWDPIGPVGLDPIIVTRQVPAIHIFLSLDDVDAKTPGYQKAKESTSFWPEPAVKQPRRNDDYAAKNKRTSNGSNRNSNQNRRHKPNNQKPNQSIASDKTSSRTKATEAPGTSSNRRQESTS